MPEYKLFLINQEIFGGFIGCARRENGNYARNIRSLDKILTTIEKDNHGCFWDKSI